MPKLRAIISIECIDAVVLSRHVNDVVERGGDGHLGHVERLRVNVAVHRTSEELAELVDVDVGRIQYRLVQILSGTAHVVVVRGHRNLGLCRGRDQRV